MKNVPFMESLSHQVQQKDCWNSSNRIIKTNKQKYLQIHWDLLQWMRQEKTVSWDLKAADVTQCQLYKKDGPISKAIRRL